MLNQLSLKTKSENFLGFPVLQLNPKPVVNAVVNPSYPDSWSTGIPVNRLGFSWTRANQRLSRNAGGGGAAAGKVRVIR